MTLRDSDLIDKQEEVIHYIFLGNEPLLAFLLFYLL